MCQHCLFVVHTTRLADFGEVCSEHVFDEGSVGSLLWIEQLTLKGRDFVAGSQDQGFPTLGDWIVLWGRNKCYPISHEPGGSVAN